jgi:hypothetical protein
MGRRNSRPFAHGEMGKIHSARINKRSNFFVAAKTFVDGLEDK